jgi:fibronectin type 3 domain-containing protein
LACKFVADSPHYSHTRGVMEQICRDCFAMKSYFIPSSLRACLAGVTALVLGTLSAKAFPNITNVIETGGFNEATDTVTAKWTGVTFTNGVANEPINGKGANDSYTVGVFGNHAPSYVDRNHRWTNASATVAIPPYLMGQEYIMIGNDNRERTALQLDVFVSVDSVVYLLIDNRMGPATEATARPNDPPTFGASAMQWVVDEGWIPVTNRLNRTANIAWPDEIGIDEAADGTINNWNSIYAKRFPAGSFQLKQADNTGRNMYGVVVAPAVPPPAPSNLTAASGDGKVTLNWTAAAAANAYFVKRSFSAGGPYTIIATNFTTSYMDLDVFNGDTIYYVVSAFNINGESVDSNEAVGTPKTAPANLTAIGGVGQVQLSWDALAGAASYTVLRSTTTGGPYTSVSSGVTGTTYTDTTVEGGRTYYFAVVAQMSGGGDSGVSSEASALTAPTAIPTLTVGPWAVTALELTWTVAGQVITGYVIEQSTDGVNFTPLASVAATPRSYVAADLLAGTTYYYRIQATNDSGMSGYSAVASGTTPVSGFNVNFANALNGTPANNPAPTPPGYAQDIGEAFALRTNGLTYGWNVDITTDGRWRINPASRDLRWDTFNHFQKPQVLPTAVWEIEIPVGFYRVYTVSGDPTATDSTFQFDIEGFVTGTYVPVTGAWWREFTAEVPVEDGRLTIKSGPLAANHKINFVDIYPAVPVGPSIATQPQSVTAEEYHPASLSIGVTGSYRLVYQWFHNDLPVPDGTNATLAFPQPRITDAGQYYVVVTNWGGAVTSSPVTLTVQPDVTVPTITGVTSLGGKTIDICFSEELDNSLGLVTEVFSYNINGQGTVPTNVVLRSDRRSVILQLETPVSGLFTVQVNGSEQTHHDFAGNAVPSTIQTSTVFGFADDVGNPGIAGSHFACDQAGEIEIVGGGLDIWGASDQGHLVLKPVDGDFDARVRLDALSLPATVGPATIAKAGLMVRQTPDADSPTLHLLANPLPPGRNLLEAGRRLAVGGTTSSWGTNQTALAMPQWIRMVRNADTFTGYRSSNGVDWIVFANTTQTLPSLLHVGLAVTAHTNSATLVATGLFSNFSIQSKPTITGFGFAGAEFGLSFATDVGVTYRVEYSPSLTAPAWNVLDTIVGDGTVRTVVDTSPGPPSRFYRIRRD